MSGLDPFATIDDVSFIIGALLLLALSRVGSYYGSSVSSV